MTPNTIEIKNNGILFKIFLYSILFFISTSMINKINGKIIADGFDKQDAIKKQLQLNNLSF